MSESDRLYESILNTTYVSCSLNASHNYKLGFEITSVWEQVNDFEEHVSYKIIHQGCTPIYQILKPFDTGMFTVG
jgi:hypothetical protein